MSASDPDPRARALSIQNRQSDPKSLGLSQSPAYYFEQRLRLKEKDRQPLAAIPVPSEADEHKVDVDDEETMMARRIAELTEIVARKRRLRMMTEDLVKQGRQEIEKKEAEKQALIRAGNESAKERYQRNLGVKQALAKVEGSIRQVARQLEIDEKECIEKTRQLHDKEISFLQLAEQCAVVEGKRAQVGERVNREEERVRDMWEIAGAYQDTEDMLQVRSLEHHNLAKELNNELQELKGNIRVFCRIRPLLPDDHSSLANIQTSGTQIKIVTSKGQKTFQFDKVFDQNCDQARVFEDISQLVRSALDGYKVSIFAYGQTGSGKTYTMEGPPDSRSNSRDSLLKGVIQRSVEQIFEVSEDLRRFGWTFTLNASFVEVYNEQIRDLLEGSKKMTAFSANLLEPTVVEVREPSVLYELLSRAKQQRAVAQTECNTHSSRSHSLFQLKIAGRNERDMRTTDGVLNLIDLAGSEKWDDTQSDDSRKQETIAINKSLSSLGDVIHAMVKKSSHIPFRNSKLTTILQNCLGADSKTLMFLNISPAESRTSETFNSLKFGSKVAQCNLKQQKALLGRRDY